MTRLSFFTALISLVNILNGEKNFLSFPDFKLRNYAEKIVGRRLSGSTIKQLNVTSEMSCQIECVAIGVRAIFLPEGAVNHLPKKLSQVAQIFTKQSSTKRN